VIDLKPSPRIDTTGAFCVSTVSCCDPGDDEDYNDGENDDNYNYEDDDVSLIQITTWQWVIKSISILIRTSQYGISTK
jgi:hypothetical protein